MNIRQITIKDEALKKLVVAKGELVGRGRKHYQKMMDLNEEGNKIGEDRNKIVAEIIEKTAEALKDEKMGEFELATTTEIVDGEVQVSIVDRVEQFKQNMRDEKDRSEREEAGTLTPEEETEDNKNKVIQAISSLDPMKIDSKLKEILKILQ